MEYNNWEKNKLGDVVDYILDYRGKTPKKSTAGIPTLSAKSVKNNLIDYNEVYYISKEEYKKFMTRGFPQVGDVILTMEAPLGLVSLLDRNDVGLGQRIVTIKGIEGILDNNYLKSYLQSPYGQHELHSKATGTTVVGISQKNLKNIEIIVPPYKTQIQIGVILKRFDKKIEVNNKIISNLESQAQAIFKSWFIDFEPFQDGEFIESELGMIPKGWEVSVTGKEFDIVYGKNLPTNKLKNQGYPVFGGNGQIGFYDKFLYEKSRLLVSCRGAASGKVGISKPYSYVTNNSLVFDEKDFNYFHYFKELFKTIKFENYVTGSAQPQLTIANSKDINILVPDIDNIVDFNKITEPIFKLQLMISSQNQKLAQTRDTLLPKLMSGEIDVSNIKIDIEEDSND